MGGAGYIFTGENDSDVMHNSGLINLNVVKECVKKDVKKYFILHQLVYTQLIIKKTQTIQNVKKTQLIQLYQIVSMVGRNYLVKDYIKPLREIMGLILESLDFITYSDLRVLGLVERKKHQLQCVEKL